MGSALSVKNYESLADRRSVGCFLTVTSSGHWALGMEKLAPRLKSDFCCTLRPTLRLLDHANGSIGIVGGAAGKCLANKHVPTLEASRRVGNYRSEV